MNKLRTAIFIIFVASVVVLPLVDATCGSVLQRAAVPMCFMETFGQAIGHLQEIQSLTLATIVRINVLLGAALLALAYSIRFLLLRSDRAGLVTPVVQSHHMKPWDPLRAVMARGLLQRKHLA